MLVVMPNLIVLTPINFYDALINFYDVSCDEHMTLKWQFEINLCHFMNMIIKTK